MPLWFNIALSLFYVGWLLAVLIFLSLIWRNGSRRAERIEQALIEAVQVSTKAASQAAASMHPAHEKEKGEEPPVI